MRGRMSLVATTPLRLLRGGVATSSNRGRSRAAATAGRRRPARLLIPHFPKEAHRSVLNDNSWATPPRFVRVLAAFVDLDTDAWDECDEGDQAAAMLARDVEDSEPISPSRAVGKGDLRYASAGGGYNGFCSYDDMRVAINECDGLKGARRDACFATFGCDVDAVTAHYQSVAEVEGMQPHSHSPPPE